MPIGKKEAESIISILEGAIFNAINAGDTFCSVCISDAHIEVHECNIARVSCGIESPYNNREIEGVIKSLKGWSYYEKQVNENIW